MGLYLPTIKFKVDTELYGVADNSDLIYQYNAFQNMKIDTTTGSGLSDLKLSASNAELNIDKPIELTLETAYDNSVNMIVNDHVNPVKMVNSRFYLTDSTTCKVADRKGSIDTNIYTENEFKTSAGFIKVVRNIVKLDFIGLESGGQMKVGNYTFYFKLADSDGNESDFVAESGKVVCHIGDVNQPQSIRGGQLEENSYKLIKFKLSNIDTAYDYINVYYTRSTGDSDNELIQAYKIEDKFRSLSSTTELSITGYENCTPVSLEEINTQYTNFSSVKSLSSCQNITFSGNIENNYEIYETLEKYSLFITPKICMDEEIGGLNNDYTVNTTEFPNDFDKQRNYGYYNANNIYYRLGYWDEEIYRFGIVYILNDYTLSPVFNIRGVKELSETTSFYEYLLSSGIRLNDDFILDNDNNVELSNPENSKGVFKINLTSSNEKFQVFKQSKIRPIGLKFNFTGNVIVGEGILPGLKSLTKGFFIVRQKRIPTILTQCLGIGTCEKSFTPTIKGYFNNKNSWMAESFLQKDKDSIKGKFCTPKLGRELFAVDKVTKNALLCPEAEVRKSVFSSLFNSSEYLLKPFKYCPNTNKDTSGDWLFSQTLELQENCHWGLSGLIKDTNALNTINTSLTLIDAGIELIKNNKYKFSSKSGDPSTCYTFSDPILGDYLDVNVNVAKSTTERETDYWNFTTSKIRGEFNTFIGTEANNITHGKLYNVYAKDYNWSNWKNYFKIRYNDSSPFMAVSDRMEWPTSTYNLTSTTVINDQPLNTYIDSSGTWNKITYLSSTWFSPIKGCYRGDCYINLFTHRMNWNFIDPELPTNRTIIDPYTWYKNFRIAKKSSVTVAPLGYDTESDTGTPLTDEKTLSYRKLLSLFTYKRYNEQEWAGDNADDNKEGKTLIANGLMEPDHRKYKKYSERNGIFGAEKINRPDVNAVGLGHWVTFTVCSNVNLAMRDLDYSRPDEEALHKQKRGFYPLQSINLNNFLPESDIINQGISKSTGDKYYFEIPDVPFIKTSFPTRIYYSDIIQQTAFVNGNRVFKSINYTDYTTEYGALVKLVEWYGTLIAIMEHGIMMIPVNERALMANESGQNVYINTEKVLPQNPRIISNTFGSIWAESIIKTPRFIYGIDTVAKKVWRTNGEQIELISDMKIQKFLNDHIELKEVNKDETIHTNYIKTHYNAFKQDVMFVFKYGANKWNLCWNEIIDKWVTQYTWFPEFSENINNIFYTFADSKIHTDASNYIYKHGFAGTTELEGDIDSTKWYEEQHPFEFEFVVADMPGVQKIFDNLKIISNSAEPDSLFYEVVGEGFEWNKYKSIIQPFEASDYSTHLANHTEIKKLPYILKQNFDVNRDDSFYNKTRTATRDVALKLNNKTKEVLVNCYQKGLNIKEFGRMRGNMQYLEDSWDIQIQPITFNYAHRENGVYALTPNKYEMKIRDKYIKIRVRYKGDKYAIINAIKTLYTISYS